MRGVFVTGTGTGVGKTLVSSGLLKAIRDSGTAALPVKPVQTGCEIKGGRLSASDIEFSTGMSGLKPDTDLLELMCPFRYSPGCSPHLAGRLAGIQPDVKTVTGRIKQLWNRCEFLVAEGAGGVLVPLNETEKMLDLMIELDWPVILVARGDLGTINHSLLSIAAIRSAGLEIAAVVINHLTEGFSIIEEDNPRAIAKYGNVPQTVEIPHIRNPINPSGNESFMEAMKTLAERVMEFV